MRLTQADLAALVGASRVSVNRALGQFRRSGAVSVAQDGRVIIHNEDALARRARQTTEKTFLRVASGYFSNDSPESQLAWSSAFAPEAIRRLARTQCSRTAVRPRR